MPYKTVTDLPDSVKDNLPKHAQKIFLEAFNHAYEQYKGDEIIAFKVAWSAVKKKYVKKDDKWVKIK
ncbi:MAG: ChaB family protein [archaeon]|nr:ChaB family protein [Nanoarchaeota archaeon]